MTALLMGTFSSFLLFCGQEVFGRWAMEAESKDRGGRFQPRHLPKLRCYFGLSFPTAGLPARPTPHYTRATRPNHLIAFFHTGLHFLQKSCATTSQICKAPCPRPWSSPASPLRWQSRLRRSSSLPSQVIGLRMTAPEDIRVERIDNLLTLLHIGGVQWVLFSRDGEVTAVAMQFNGRFLA